MKTAKCCDCGNVKELSERNYGKVKMGVSVYCFECNRSTPHEFGTQENWPTPGAHQMKLMIGDKEFAADPEMAHLLMALNEVGLETRSHCSGHGKGHSWVVIRMDSIVDVQIRNDGQYKELVLGWLPPKGFARSEEESG